MVTVSKSLAVYKAAHDIKGDDYYLSERGVGGKGKVRVFWVSKEDVRNGDFKALLLSQRPGTGETLVDTKQGRLNLNAFNVAASRICPHFVASTDDKEALKRLLRSPQSKTSTLDYVGTGRGRRHAYWRVPALRGERDLPTFAAPTRPRRDLDPEIRPDLRLLRPRGSDVPLPPAVTATLERGSLTSRKLSGSPREKGSFGDKTLGHGGLGSGRARDQEKTR